MPYRLYVNAERTVLVRIWEGDDAEKTPSAVEAATRETPAHTWGPPIWLHEEKV